MKYVIMRRSSAGLQYYRSGEGHGWRAGLRDATKYSEEDFAERDRSCMSRDLRLQTEVISVEDRP